MSSRLIESGEVGNCPQCGTDGYRPGIECRSCGFNADQAETAPPIRKSMDNAQRDVLNGVGLGCTVMCFVWLFAWSLVWAIAAHIHKFSAYGPAFGNAVPVLVVVILYLVLRRKPTSFSKGVGFSLLLTLAIALIFGYIGIRYHDSKPPPNGAGNGFE